jgi:hypothetical protein
LRGKRQPDTQVALFGWSKISIIKLSTDITVILPSLTATVAPVFLCCEGVSGSSPSSLKTSSFYSFRFECTESLQGKPLTLWEQDTTYRIHLTFDPSLAPVSCFSGRVRPDLTYMGFRYSLPPSLPPLSKCITSISSRYVSALKQPESPDRRLA